MNTGFNLIHLIEALNEIGDMDAPVFPHSNNYTTIENGHATSFKDDSDNTINIEIIQVPLNAISFVKQEKVYNMSFDVNGKDIKDENSVPYKELLKLIRTTVVIAFEFIDKHKPNGLLISAAAGTQRKTKVLNALYHSYISNNKAEGYAWGLEHIGAIPVYYIKKEEEESDIKEMLKEIFK